jgi:hypothetical protein
MSTEDCVHYWIIDTPEGRTSWGECVKCFVQKEFQNTDPLEMKHDWGMLNSLSWEVRKKG